jgi:hypothetical protein
MSDEAQVRESELLNLLKKKEKYLTNEEQKQFNLLIKEQDMREKVRSQERKKIIDDHELKQEEELIKLKKELNQLENNKNKID